MDIMSHRSRSGLTERIILSGAWIIIVTTFISIGLALPAKSIPGIEGFPGDPDDSRSNGVPLESRDRIRNENTSEHLKSNSEPENSGRPKLKSAAQRLIETGKLKDNFVKYNRDNLRLDRLKPQSKGETVLEFRNNLANTIRLNDSIRYNKSALNNTANFNETYSSNSNELQTSFTHGYSTVFRQFDPPATQIQPPQLLEESLGGVTARSHLGVPLVVEKIFWSEAVERLLPPGIEESSDRNFRAALSKGTIARIEPSAWNRCGRPYNKFIALKDGTKLCSRYRHPHDSLVIGEILSYHLSKLLGLDSVPVVVSSRADQLNPLWRDQMFETRSSEDQEEPDWINYDPDQKYNWTSGAPLALIQWIEDLSSYQSHVKLPSKLLKAYHNGYSLNGSSLLETTSDTNDVIHDVTDASAGNITDVKANDIISLVQWSDLILFDYITGHYDRFASMQDGAWRENRTSILEENVRNLRQLTGSPKLILIDNESGLLDAYWLLYRGGKAGKQFIEFHQKILQSTCLFRRKTVEKILRLLEEPDPAEFLISYAISQDSGFKDIIDTASKELQAFKMYFSNRLKEVMDQITQCKR